MGSITFDQIPAGNRTPNVYMELGESSASVSLALPTLFIGPKTGGTQAVEKVAQVFGPEDARGRFGSRSPLAETLVGYREIDAFSGAFAIGFTPAAGVAASGSLAITGPATASGVFVFWVAGRRYAVSVADTDSATVIGDAVAAAVNADATALVTAANVTGTVTFTASWAGTSGNDLDLRVKDVDPLPAGVAVTVNAFAGGTLAADLTNVIAAMGGTHWRRIVYVGNDATEIGRLETELVRRFGPTVGQYGQLFHGLRGTIGELGTWASSRNSFHTTAISAQKSTTNPWIIAAQAVARDVLVSDPTLTRHGQRLNGVDAPDMSDLWDAAERTAVLALGISTIRANNGIVVIDRLVTNYTTNDQGIEDETFRSLETMNGLDLWFRQLQLLGSTWLQRKLIDDGQKVNSGIRVISPGAARAEILSLYAVFAADAHGENEDGFESSLYVERPSDNRDRLDAVMTVFPSGQPITVAFRINVTK